MQEFVAKLEFQHMRITPLLDCINSPCGRPTEARKFAVRDKIGINRVADYDSAPAGLHVVQPNVMSAALT